MTNQELLEKLAQDSASEADLALFWDRLKQLSQQEVTNLLAQYENILEQETNAGPVDERMLREMQQRVATWEPPAKLYPLRRHKWRYIAIAASLLILFTAGGYFWFLRNPSQPVVSNNTEIPNHKKIPLDIGPGREGAILILSDGTELLLDSLGNGDITTQNGTRVVLQNGQLSYHPAAKATENIVFNTMTTPKGRQFTLVLPDGSRVWLNAASSLRYPTAFSGKERKVEVIGEVYFEIAQNANLPFRVDIAGKGQLEVLGTSFNVNAYENQAHIDMTLIEGAVKVLAGSKDKKTGTERSVVLRSGQQAQLMTGPQTTTAIKVIDNVDMEKVMAWKNGLFNFNGLTFQEIMQQLERWYDIKVVYENNIPPNKRLAGEMTRGVSLNGLLKQLGEMGVRYKLTGRTLLVLQ
jgi:transmembrane sensor